MHSVLFAIVAALALHHVFACKVTVLKANSLTGVIDTKFEGDLLKTEVLRDMEYLGFEISYYKDSEWQSLNINDLCENNTDIDVFKKIFNDVLGFNSCSITEGNYEGKRNIEYPDDVCSEVSEKTDGNYEKLYMRLREKAADALILRLKMQD